MQSISSDHWSRCGVLCLTVLGVLLAAGAAHAHNVGHSDQTFLEQSRGINIAAYMYLGAKHMVTGYDHVLYLAGVVFFLHKIRDVISIVSFFAIGHSITLMTGVLAGWHVNPYLVDAIIGLSVAYKAFENLGGFRAFSTVWLDARAAVFLFGLVHGLGLSTKLQDFTIDESGLVINMISFNIGVEIGQLVALTFLMLGLNFLRKIEQFQRSADLVNLGLMTAGFLLMGYQLVGYFVHT